MTETNGAAPVRVGVLLAQFSAGGAERQTFELVRRLDPAEFEPTCIVLSDTIEPYGTRLRSMARRVLTLERGGSYDFGRVLRLRRLLRDEAIDLVLAIGYEPASYAYFALAGRPGVALVPSIRSAVLHPKWPKPWIYRLLFRRSARVIYNSRRGLDFGLDRFGVPAERSEVVRNGLPFDEIALRAAEGGDVRAELGVPPGTPLVGFVGKDSWQKNVRRFLAAMAEVRRERPDVHAVVVGWKLGPADAPRLGVTDPAIHFLGVRQDVYRIIRSLDVLALTSETEGCPNVVLEAAGLDVPVVAADVGDVAEILGAEGIGGLVRRQDPVEYGRRIVAALRDPGAARSVSVRLGARVRRDYAVRRMVDDTRTVFRAALDHGNRVSRT